MTSKQLYPQSNILEYLTNENYERVIHYSDPEYGLKVIVAIHDRTLGPALGGARMLNYTNENDALIDVLRLSQGMTYKSSLAGLNLGGGKAVIIGDVNKLKNEEFLKAYGRFIESLNGLYITAADVNTNIQDMYNISKETKHVVALPLEHGGSGDPSFVTAKGVYLAMKASAKKLFGNDNLNNRKIAVQGLGKVGKYIAKFAYEDGAELTVTDINESSIREISDKYKVKVVPPDEIYDIEVDIFSPCALGGIINDETINRLRCKIVSGGANNQLKDYIKHDQELFNKGILYTPDFASSAGGVINVYTEYLGHYDEKKSISLLENIYKVCLDIFDESEKQNKPTHQIALELAKKRIEEAKKVKL